MSYMWQLHIISNKHIQYTISLLLAVNERWALQPVVLTYHHVNIYWYMCTVFRVVRCNITTCILEMIINLTTKWHATKYTHIQKHLLFVLMTVLHVKEIKMDLVSCVFIIIIFIINRRCVPFWCVCVYITGKL